jgi:hypothetical protein
MALHPVSQDNHTGCFIACVGMLLGKTYSEAFQLLHPGKDPITTYPHGFRDMSMENIAHKLLQGLGFQTHTGKYKQFATYRKRSNKHAIMIIRWEFDPTMCHCIMFDAEAKRFIEPDGGYIVDSKYTLKSLQRQLDCSIVIDKIPNLENRHDIHRSPDPLGLSW